MLHGYHLTHPLGNVPAINALGGDWWAGTDNVLRVIRNPSSQPEFYPLIGEYVPRVPHDIGVTEAQNIQQLPATMFKNSWIILNEGDLNGKTPAQCAALATTAIQNIQAADPARANKIMLCAGSQKAGTAYVAQVLALLSPAIRAMIDGLAWHYYPQVDPTPTGGIWDENRLRTFLTTVCTFTAAQGFTKAWLSEFGWGADADAWRVSKELPKFVAVMNEFAILKRWNYYCANGDNMNLLVNANGLTWVGQAYKGL